MMRSLWTAASGMKAQQTSLDIISNNLSNINTTGYKKETAEFRSLLYQNIQKQTTDTNGQEKPIGAQVGLGVKVAAVGTTFKQGNFATTDGAFDFAINGKGFFMIEQPDGSIAYTRNGNFTWSIGNDGVILTNSDGYPVLDSRGNMIRIPDGVAAEKVSVTSQGQFYYRNAQGNPVDMNQSIGLFQFNNPGGLEKLQDSLLRVTDASGNPMNEATTAGLDRSNVRQGYLEGSNVQVADEMVNLIIAQRAYELNSKAIQASDDMLSQANQLRR